MDLATAAHDSFPEGFSMRAGVQHFLPARRAARVDKPRKVEAAIAGAPYGERALAGEAVTAAGAALSALGAPAAVIFHHLGRGCSVDWTRITQP